MIRRIHVVTFCTVSSCLSLFLQYRSLSSHLLPLKSQPMRGLRLCPATFVSPLASSYPSRPVRSPSHWQHRPLPPEDRKDSPMSYSSRRVLTPFFPRPSPFFFLLFSSLTLLRVESSVSANVVLGFWLSMRGQPGVSAARHNQ